MLLAPVVASTDWMALSALTRTIAPDWILLALALFALEGVCASLRLRQFARHPRRPPPSRRAAFAANGWYVPAVALLPARLGEAVGVIVTHRLLGASPGAAAVAILAQRLLDLAVLAGIALPLALAVLLFADPAGTTWTPDRFTVAALAGGLLVLATLGFLWRPDLVLAPVGRLAVGMRGGRGPVRGLARLVLQARGWARHLYRHLPRAEAALLTVIKWGATLTGLAAVMAGVGPPLAFATLMALAVLYCFVMAVPIPTLGGIGLSEVGLTALLGASGVPVGEAAAASLLVRAVLLIFPGLYAGGTWAALAATRRG